MLIYFFSLYTCNWIDNFCSFFEPITVLYKPSIKLSVKYIKFTFAEFGLYSLGICHAYYNNEIDKAHK